MTNEEELMAVANEEETPKKKRTRVTKKSATDADAAPEAAEGEEVVKKKRVRTSKAKAEAVEADASADNTVAPLAETAASADNTDAPLADAAEVEQPKKKRGRRSKAEIIAAAAAAAEALAQSNQQKSTQQEMLFAEEEAGMVPEASDFGEDSADDENKAALLEQLQDKVRIHNEEAMPVDEVWAGDPGDGTDFIIVTDLPVEDNAAIPYYDMFDNPTNVVAQEDTVSQEAIAPEEQYDFRDIITANGLLEVMPDGYGFLRSSDYNYLSSPDDVHLTMQQIKQYSLKTGDVVECRVRPPHGGEKYFTMSTIIKVNGRNPLDIRDRISFENLTPLFPEEKFMLCGTPSATNNSTRIVDLFAPIGKGQRSLIVAQPKTGKTILMKDIANAIAANHPEAYIMMLLIDERPEEVTDMARTVNAEVIASTFDEPADRHVKIAGLVLEKAKRLVECGHDVVIFLDSITRLARAYNTVAPASGKVLTGGVDANALQKPKRFFGAARNIEGGGSLTIIATALTDTGSKMDEVIFEEFKGTGNSELQLDRQLANKRIFPAVNLVASSTRRDDLLQDDFTIKRMWVVRNHISDMTAQEAMNVVDNLMKRTSNNDEFLQGMNG